MPLHKPSILKRNSRALKNNLQIRISALRILWSHTHWGFPVGPDDTNQDPPRHQNAQKPRENLRRQRGIALLIAIMIISIMMLFTSDLILMSQVNITLAAHQRDSVKAEYLGKSGLNVALLLLSSDFAYDLFQAQQNAQNPGLSDGLSDIWGALNGFPIGGGTLELAEQFKEEFGLNAVMDSGVIDQLNLLDGMFTVQVQDEAQKINLNNCYQGRCPEILAMLEGLLSCPAEKLFLEQKKLNPRELVYRIKDYIDQDKRAESASGFTDENDPYVRRTPKMQAKNAPLDTVDELRVIEGWDEEVHAVFSRYLTAFPFVSQTNDRTKLRLNINTASRSLLQCLFPESRTNCAEKVAQGLAMRDRDQTPFAIPGVNMKDVLRDQLCYTGGGGGSGVESNDKSDWFRRSSMIYRVEVEGNSGDSSRKLEAVIERIMPDFKKNEKSSFRILFWKLI